MLPYALIPQATVRLYAPEHENAQREFSHIDKFLFDERKGLARVLPHLREGLTKYQPEPSVGRLEMAWKWGTTIRSMSWERRKQWAGEPIDLGIICEPGLQHLSQMDQAEPPGSLRALLLGRHRG